MKKANTVSYLLFVVVVGFGIWDGKKFTFGTGINITDPQHCVGSGVTLPVLFEKKVLVLVIFCFPSSIQASLALMD
jgi:hypothetical protein